MKNIGLVLEGGGMKGLYTAGVLEYFMEKNLFFPYVVGVSTGACMGATYLSRQKGRNEKQRNKFSGLAKILYRKYPNIAQSLVEHYRFYNETISYMNQRKQKDNFYVIQPSVQLPISGIERNKEKLVNLYNLGYTDAQYHYENLLNWIEK